MSKELKQGENHPSAKAAFPFIKNRPLQDLCMWQESFSSCAIEGNRLAKICSGTLERIMKGEPVGERYVFGLALAMLKTPDDLMSKRS
jgi:hypothetical protein